MSDILKAIETVNATMPQMDTELLRDLATCTCDEDPQGCVPCYWEAHITAVAVLLGVRNAVANAVNIAFLAGREHALQGRSLEAMLADLNPNKE